MVKTYDIIEFLCKRNDVSISEMCNAIGIRRGLITDLKYGRTKNLSYQNLSKIASYFNVSTDIFSPGVFEETLPSEIDMELIDDIIDRFSVKSKSDPSPKAEVSDDDIKFALFGGAKVTDAQFEEVKRFARYIAENNIKPRD